MIMTDLAEKAAENLMALRENKPLVHNITNYVVMNYTANALLAMGASPVMAHAPNEVEDMVAFAGALVLNIGTLTDAWIESMVIAGKKASQLGTPIVLDPVGSGATPLRTASAKKIISNLLRHLTEPFTFHLNSSHNFEKSSKKYNLQSLLYAKNVYLYRQIGELQSEIYTEYGLESLL